MQEEQVVESAEEVAEEPPKEETEEIQEEAPAEEPEEEPVVEQPPKKKQTAQERINELTRIRREKEREAEYWRKVALEKSEKPKPEPKDDLPARPKLEQFESSEQYEDALFEWRDTVRDIKSQEERKKTEYETAIKSFNERAAKLRAEHADFDEAIEAEVFSPVMREALLQSENGPQVAYHLGRPENWDLANKIRELSPTRQLYELGKLETQLLVVKQTKKVTAAPPPIKPVGITGGGEKDPSKMSTAEWMEWDKQQTLEKIKRKISGG